MGLFGSKTQAKAKPSEPPAKLPDGVRGKKKPRNSSTQQFLPLAEIKDDTVVLRNGGVRAVLKVNSLNFNLKSEVEQQGIITGYQSFVNTLVFPIQIMIRSTRLNIDPYIKGLEEQAKNQTNALLKEQTLDYAGFMAKLVDIADIMQKSFFIVIPVDSSSTDKRGLLTRFYSWLNYDDSSSKALQRSREFKALQKALRDRITLVQSGLENVGITMKRLSTDELAQLYYGIYNPLTSQKQKFNGLPELNLDKSVLI